MRNATSHRQSATAASAVASPGMDAARALILEGQNEVLRLIAAGVELTVVLDRIARFCEQVLPRGLCSVLLADHGLTLRHGAAPSLPAAYCAAIDGIQAGPGVGSCGTAVAERRLVIVENIDTHPYWKDYKHIAQAHGLGACWSTCILGGDRRALGSFAVYYREPRAPEAWELDVIDGMKDLAAIAIERHETQQRQAGLIADLREQQARAEAAAQRLRDSEQRFRDLTDSSSDFYWEQDASHRYSFLSASSQRMLGIEPAALIGQTWRATLPLGMSDEAMRAHDADLQAHRPFRDLRFHRVDAEGRLHYLSINGVPVLDPATGAFLGYRGTGRDISDDARTVETFRAMIDAIPAMINAKDLSGRYLLMNAYQAKLYGTTPAGAVGRTSGELLGRDYGSYTGGIDQRVIETGQSTGFFEEMYAGVDGVKRHWLTAKLPLKDVRGQVQHVISIAMDITAMKATEQELRASQDALSRAIVELQQSDRAKSNFLASMSHELRTPLNAIIGFAEIMANEMLGPLGSGRYKEYADDIYRSGRFLHDLISDMLDMAKIEAGRRDLSLEPIDPGAEILETVRMIGPRAEAGKVAVETELTQAPVSIEADRRAFRQIVLNIVSNAVKFTPEGGHVVIAMDRNDRSKPRLRISDTGIGIAPHQIDRLGRPFYRIEDPTQASTEGFGLGLALTKSLVELHGWSIHFDSQVGRGTIVTVTM
jgi:PAS domain S-box-containing protein